MFAAGRCAECGTDTRADDGVSISGRASCAVTGTAAVKRGSYGRNVEATVVHHIWPAEDWPEYAWADWNLLSLSAEAHRAMHNDDGSLSALGESWRRRTIPPTP